MANCAIVGINWGDEGKGRMVDLLTEDYDIVVRFQGGGNAGHTVINEKGKFALHLLPSGIFRSGVVNVLGNGVAVDPENLWVEMHEVMSKGVALTPENLKISDRASLLLPWHRDMDELEEQRLADKKYGSTKQGIAPFYSDKYQKKTILAGELFYPEELKAHLADLMEWKNLTLTKVYGAKPYTMAMLEEWLATYCEKIKPYICDIVVNDDGVFVSHKDLGLVSEVFSGDILSRLPKGTMAVAHARYGTTGGTNRNNCQPIEVNHQKGRMALAHNGNLSNAAELRNELELTGAIFHTTSDTETIAYIITKERLKASSIEDAVSQAMNTLDGAYSLVLMSPQKLICARDPYGFRPLCYGKTADGMYVVASESCAVKAVGGEVVRDVKPGEILVFTKNGVISRCEHCDKKSKKLCIFEYIYFARPDSVIDGISVHTSRIRAGKILAKAHPVEADVVIGAPDSGLDAALGFSQESGIPYGIGLIKNKYVGRTFISPGQGARLDGVKIKLAAVEESVKGKRVVLVDDSIVRGNTMGRVVKLLRDAGAEEVHIRISSPPFLHPCYYGTDIDSEEHLIACRHSIKEIANIIGADSLGYLPTENLSLLTGNSDFCSACFNGEYPTSVPTDTRRDRFEQRLSDKKK